jgi:hypothetical protein
MHWAMNCSFAKHFLKVFGYRDCTRDPSEFTELFNIRRILNKDERYIDVRDVLEGTSLKSVMARRTAEQEDWPSVEGLIRRAMQQIALAADIMISTTHGSLERLTKFFNKTIAKVTVLMRLDVFVLQRP